MFAPFFKNLLPRPLRRNVRLQTSPCTFSSAPPPPAHGTGAVAGHTAGAGRSRAALHRRTQAAALVHFRLCLPGIDTPGGGGGVWGESGGGVWGGLGGSGGGGDPTKRRLFKLDFPSAKFWVEISFWAGGSQSQRTPPSYPQRLVHVLSGDDDDEDDRPRSDLDPQALAELMRDHYTTQRSVLDRSASAPGVLLTSPRYPPAADPAPAPAGPADPGLLSPDFSPRGRRARPGSPGPAPAAELLSRLDSSASHFDSDFDLDFGEAASSCFTSPRAHAPGAHAGSATAGSSPPSPLAPPPHALLHPPPPPPVADRPPAPGPGPDRSRECGTPDAGSAPRSPAPGSAGSAASLAGPGPAGLHAATYAAPAGPSRSLEGDGGTPRAPLSAPSSTLTLTLGSLHSDSTYALGPDSPRATGLGTSRRQSAAAEAQVCAWGGRRVVQRMHRTRVCLPPLGQGG